MINHYLKYKKNPDRKTRFDLLAYTLPVYESECFKPLEKAFIYASRNPNIKAHPQRKSDLQISWKSKNLSSVYFIEINKPGIGYGDIIGTDDLIIFVVKDETIEMFIMLNNKNHLNMIIDILYDNELDIDMEYLRNNAASFTYENQGIQLQTL